MSTLFGGPKPKVDQNAQRAQRQQEQTINKQTSDEAKDFGARRRIIAARSGGNSSLYASGGAAGVKDALGG